MIKKYMNLLIISVHLKIKKYNMEIELKISKEEKKMLSKKGFSEEDIYNFVETVMFLFILGNTDILDKILGTLNKKGGKIWKFAFNLVK